MVAVTILAYTNNIPSGWFRAPADKVAHAVLYGWLAGCAAYVTPPARRVWAWAGPLLVAVADELTQSYSRLRSPDIWDFAADALGIALAYTLVTTGFRPRAES